MLAHAVPRKPAPMLAARGVWGPEDASGPQQFNWKSFVGSVTGIPTSAADLAGMVAGYAMNGGFSGASNGDTTQGEGPWSDMNYENGSDIQDTNAVWNNHVARVSGGYTGDAYPSYDDTFGRLAAAQGGESMPASASAAQLEANIRDLKALSQAARTLRIGSEQAPQTITISDGWSRQQALMADRQESFRGLEFSAVQADYPDVQWMARQENFRGAEIQQMNEVAATPSFQQINDQRVIAGNYDRFRAIGSALSAGQYGDAWRHVTFEASGSARAALNARLNPPPNPDLARLDKMLASPWAASAYAVANLSGASPRTQDALVDIVGTTEQALGARTSAPMSRARVRPNLTGGTAGPEINPRLTERLDAWRTYKDRGGPLDLRGWVQRTQGAPWATGFKSGYADWSNRVDSVHGNSTLSTRPTTLYKLYTDEGTFLKWGISQDMNTRYPGSFMADKQIFRHAEGPRAEMLRLEREMVETQPGPRNFEPWAGRRSNGGQNGEKP